LFIFAIDVVVIIIVAQLLQEMRDSIFRAVT